MRIYTGSLGCKLNQSEMDALEARLAATGHEIVVSPAESDLCVLNTCAVTHVAAQKSRQALRRLHRQNPQARLVVTGCYAELSPGDLRDLPGVELVIGNQDKARLADLIGGGGQAVDPSWSHPAEFGKPLGSMEFHPPHRRTRALVKIQDGCDNACSYCLIHVARGPQRSRAPTEILEEVQARLAAGHQEIVLTGVHIGAYGSDRESATPDEQPGSGPDLDLWGLVARILNETDVPRLRLSSIEPWDLPEQAFALWKDARLCRHLHLPLQSGCSATLQRMARHYSPSGFAALVEAARAAIPDLAVTTDVIVGFPGEADWEFAESLAFAQAMQFSRVHVFPFSARPGTPAAQMPDQVPAEVKAQRSRTMRTVAASCERVFHERFVGRTMSVLWESFRPAGDSHVWHGLTGNYLRVHSVSASGLANNLTPARLIAWDDGSLRGMIENEKSGERTQVRPPLDNAARSH
jgi:threonylcarbamoyladenosine tRNA methylthiotransferase MtaB